MSANGKDLVKIASDTTDMIQLLKGLPTSISREERLSLIELGPKLVAEMKRRGITIEGNAEKVPGALGEG